MQNNSAKTGGRSRFWFDRLEEQIAPSAMATSSSFSSGAGAITSVSAQGVVQTHYHASAAAIVTDELGNGVLASFQRVGVNGLVAVGARPCPLDPENEPGMHYRYRPCAVRGGARGDRCWSLGRPGVGFQDWPGKTAMTWGAISGEPLPERFAGIAPSQRWYGERRRRRQPSRGMGMSSSLQRSWLDWFIARQESNIRGSGTQRPPRWSTLRGGGGRQGIVDVPVPQGSLGFSCDAVYEITAPADINFLTLYISDSL